MSIQTQESKRAGMDAFLDIFEEFDACMYDRGAFYTILSPKDRIAMFTAYITRME